MANVTTVNLLALATSIPYQNQLLSLSNQSTTPPNLTFLSYNPAFANITGPHPSSQLIASRDYQFVHEAGIYLPRTNSLYISSNFAGIGNPINVTVLGLDEYQVTNERPLNGVINPNGGCEYPYPYPANGTASVSSSQQLLFTTQGSLNQPSALVLADPVTNTSRPLLNSYQGEKQFNSINDAKVHGKTGDIFFTDAPYAYYQGFRPAPVLPNQAYRFTPSTGELAVVADEQVINNGIEFSPDFDRVYITDTGESQGAAGKATIYVYDVTSDGKRLHNRRVFAYAGIGIPDGIHTDKKGNVYAGVGDGVQVWSPSGTLLGKIVAGTTCNNFAFTLEGIVMFCNEQLWLAKIAARGRVVREQKSD